MKTIIITKKNGKVSGYEEHLENGLETRSNGEHTIGVTKNKSKRTLSQNAQFWLWMEYIAGEIGSTNEDLHDYFCKKFLQRQVKMDKRIETVVGGTRNLSKSEFAVFLNKVKEEAASEFGIILPDSSDEYFPDLQEPYEDIDCFSDR
ncbi:MAG: hypothetical protein LBV72_19840 [Tannerella sp.]|jgi:hypothetical protein|nr:hypothetical protein [Tannerella sp.]